MYEGPLREEPLAIELNNTVYAAGGGLVDGLAAPRPWLEAIAPRLPAGRGAWPPADALRELREAVGTALHAALDGTAPDPAALDALNRAAARAPRSARVEPGLAAGTDYHGATRADIVLAAFAADAIELLTGPHRADLRACGAPGCVLLFLKDHPRREWCGNACGNRARQARHYRRTRQAR
jgi:predicted RNA-binding Zn ribbon-like protein